MPRRDVRLRLQDMLDAIRRIHEHVGKIDSSQFSVDGKTVDAVLFNLGVLGEAASNIPDAVRALEPQIPWQSVRGMRNVIIHEYFGIDLNVVWGTIRDDLHGLEDHLVALIARLPRDDDATTSDRDDRDNGSS